ncbi:PDDEXK nuclease domain-containing protein [Rhodococcus qingshengii]|uniref:PDDEXK nuclease domain-containing protein n=1 Tax=Rhodococcus qingshengii TaxID=334542 RepID=UPI0037CC3E57
MSSPWHITVLLDRLSDTTVRVWYAEQAAHHGWSRATLTHHISSQRHLRVGNAPNNFPSTLATHESDLAHSILQDPYNLDSGHSERELEDALIGRATHFLSELGAGFAFVGRQYKITAGEHDYFLNLLFFHLGQRRFVVFELKVGQAEPEHIGKLNFYVNVVDDQLRKPEHGGRRNHWHPARNHPRRHRRRIRTRGMCSPPITLPARTGRPAYGDTRSHTPNSPATAAERR